MSEQDDLSTAPLGAVEKATQVAMMSFDAIGFAIANNSAFITYARQAQPTAYNLLTDEQVTAQLLVVGEWIRKAAIAGRDQLRARGDLPSPN